LAGPLADCPARAARGRADGRAGRQLPAVADAQARCHGGRGGRMSKDMATDERKSPAVETKALTVQLGEREVLRQVSLQIPKGRWTAIVGPNGAGKSTLLRAIAGMRAAHQQQSGDVLLQGRKLDAWNGRDRA